MLKELAAFLLAQHECISDEKFRLADYVLEPFDEEQEPLVNEVVESTVACIECWLARGVVAAMERFNQPQPVSAGVPQSPASDGEAADSDCGAPPSPGGNDS